MKHILKKISIALFAIAIFTLCISQNLSAQVVKQAIAEQSTTINKYVYTYNISESVKKDLRYIIVKSSSGEIKTCFDACYVCKDTGYIQSNAKLVCKKCFLTFNIDDLGSQKSGTCDPVLLPHTIDGDSVSIKISDLISGAKYFQESAIMGVSDNMHSCCKLADKNCLSVICKQNSIQIKNTANSNCKYSIVNIDGKLCKEFTNSTNDFSIETIDLPDGVYILTAEISGKIYSKSFYVNK